MSEISDPSSESSNTPEWEEDPNSPFTVTGSHSFTMNLANSWDELRVTLKTKNETGPTDMAMRVNGVSSSYDGRFVDGSGLSGASAWHDVFIMGGGSGLQTLLLQENNGNNAVLGVLTAPNVSDHLAYGENASVSPPFSSLKVINWNGSETADWTVEVLGRNK